MIFANVHYENKALGYEVLAVDGTVKTPTPTAGTRYAEVYMRGANVRITFHGVDPGAAFGVPFYDGYEGIFAMTQLNGMRLTREGATNGEVHFVYYK